MKKSRIIATVLCLTLMFTTLVGCSDKGDYWNVVALSYDDANSTKRESFIDLNVSPSKNYEIWINVKAIEDDEAIIKAAAGYSTGKTFYAKTPDITVTKQLITDTLGWIRLRKDVSSSYTLVDVSTSYAMKINEIVVCSADGEIYPVSYSKAGYRVSRDRTDMRKEFTKEELESMSFGPQNVVKADTTFDRATAIANYEKATGSADASSSS